MQKRDLLPEVLEMSYVTKCGHCQKEIRLQKDSTEGLPVYHGGCFELKKLKEVK